MATVAELRVEAQRVNLPNYTRMKKTELIKALGNYKPKSVEVFANGKKITMTKQNDKWVSTPGWARNLTRKQIINIYNQANGVK